MKEITITSTIKLPTADEIKAAVKSKSPIEPKQAVVVHCFVDGYDYGDEANKAVYECMNEADESLRNTIASDVVAAYCDENKIKWGSIRVLSVANYGKHFVIEAVIETRD